MIGRLSLNKSWVGNPYNINGWSSFLVRALAPYTALVSFFPVKGFFMELEVEADAMGIFPLFIPLSTLSPVRISSMKPDEEQPSNKLKMDQIICP